MARQEKIEILIDSSKTVTPIQKLKDEADALKKAFGSIQIAQATQQMNAQAQAATAAARAAQANANAQAAQARATAAAVNIQTAQARAAQAQANAQNAQNRAAQSAIGIIAAQANAANAAARAQAAQTNAQTANIRQQQAQANATAANVRVQQEQVNLMTAWARLQNTLNAGHNRAANALQRMGQVIGNVNQNQAQAVQYMTQWIRQQNGLNAAHVQATGAIHNAAGEFQTYRAAVSEAGGATHNYRMAVNTATGEVYQLDQGIRTTSVSLRDMSSILRAVRTVVGFTGIAQSMRSAFTEMKSMSDELVTYRKVTGATAQEMERIRSSAYETSKRYGQKPSDFLSQAATMARAGYGQNATAMAELATKTQLVGDMTADAASKFLIAVDAAYQLGGSVETLTHILDGANVIDNNYATTIEKISEGMTLTASLASSAHVPVEQLTAALGVMTAVTQRSGTETARGLRQIMLNIIGDTTTEIEEGVTVAEEEISAMQQALMRYTPEVVKAAQATGKLINPMEAIAALAKQYKEGLLTETELFGITESIGGKRYYNVFTALIQNYDMYEEMLGKVMQSTGSADAEVAAMLDGWTVKVNQLSATWTQVVNNTVSENFIKGLIDGGIAALEFAGNLENLALMAGGAYEAIRSLSAGIANLRAGAQFGGFNAGMTALGLGVAAIGTWKAAYEKAIKDAQQSAAKQVAEALNDTTYKTVAEIEQKYIATEKGDIETLKTLQDALNKAVGEQGTAIDLVNGKYEEQITKLQNLTREQRELAAETLRTAMSAAVSAFNQSDLNGFWRTGNSTGVNLPDIAAISGYLSSFQYLQFSEDAYYGNKQLWLRSKPTDAEGILAFYKEVEDFYTFLGSHTATGEKASQGMKTIGEQYSTMYTALGKFVSTVRDAADPVKAAQEGLDALAESLEELGGGGNDSAGAAEKGIGGVTESVNSLTDALNGATKAKEAFDDAMKTSKADAMNDYIEAFDTLKKEIDAGRVNSTAFYASARMLMGETAYNATGGSSQAVIEALNRRGESGSLLDAEKILNQTYYDELGNIIEGYGMYQLLSQTKGFNKSQFINEEGYATVPDLSETDIQRISESWGGLSESLITSWLNALDQYDKEGKATDEKVQAKTAEKQLGEEAVTTAEAVNTLGESAKEAAEALSELGNQDGETEIDLAEIDTSKIGKDISNGIEKGFDNGTKTVAKQADKIGEETEKTSENVLDSYYTIAEKMQAFIDAVEDANGNVDQAIKNLGTTWEEVASIMEQSGFDMVVDVESAKEELEKFFDNNSDKELVFGLNADPSKAIATADAAINRINRKTATIQINAKDNTGSAGGSSGTILGTIAKAFSGIRLANGTSSHPGGPAIVNDGNGPELIVDRGRAFIAGGGKPAMVSLSKGARVFTASETRGILSNGGAPAYAAGVVPMDGVGTKIVPVSLSIAAQKTGSWIPSTLGFKPSGVTTKAPNTDSKEGSSNKSSGSNANNSGSKKQTDEEAFASLKEMIDYIIGRIGEGLDEQLDILDKQIDALKQQRDALDAQNELEEKQKAVAEAQKDLETALSERTVRYLGEDGKWHWMADARNVQTAQENLQKAQDDLSEYQEKAAYEAEVAALEAQKKALQEEYTNITDAWSKIQAGVETPTGDLSGLISAVLTGGTPQQQTGANAIRDYLIGNLITGGSYAGNYSEALDSIAKATAGSPIMPDGSGSSLAALIATGGGLTGSTAESLRVMNGGVTSGVTGAFGDGGTHINYNYFVNGIEIGAEAAQGMTLSEVMRSLTVYAGQ